MTTMKTLAGFLILMTAISASITARTPQEPDAAAAERARAEALARAREQQARREEQAQRDWLARENARSESNLDRARERAAPFRGRENETKFLALQASTQELVDLSIKIKNQLNASGAQSISVSFYSDLDKLEKVVKAIRKSAK